MYTILTHALFAVYLCRGDLIERKQMHRRHHHHPGQQQQQQQAAAHFNDYDDDASSAHVVVSREGPPPSPQEYTISKLEEPVICGERGEQTWHKWKKYDLDGICSRLQYYGEIEGQCETDCDLLCPQGFYEVAKEPCSGAHNALTHLSGGGVGNYRLCVGRYKCTQSSYDYWVNMKWWQFLIWEVVIVVLGCCFFGLAIGCVIRCVSGPRNRSASNANARAGSGNDGGGGGGGGAARPRLGSNNNNAASGPPPQRGGFGHQRGRGQGQGRGNGPPPRGAHGGPPRGAFGANPRGRGNAGYPPLRGRGGPRGRGRGGGIPNGHGPDDDN